VVAIMGINNILHKFHFSILSLMIFANATTANKFAELPIEALLHILCVRKNTLAICPPPPPPLNAYFLGSVSRGLVKNLISQKNNNGGSYEQD